MNAQNLRSWRVLPGLVIVLSLLLSGAAIADAPEVGPTTPQSGPSGPAGTPGVDDANWDVGAEYPSADAPGTEDDRPVHRDSAYNFYNKMRAAGYTGSDSFIYGNTAAWETDGKRAALGGQEELYFDDVDIMFVHSHGNHGYVWYPWGHTDTQLTTNDCAWSWGTTDLEWIGIKTCKSLSDAVGWATCMNGVHVIAGFTTNSASVEFGGYWADQLLGWKIWLPLIGDVWLRSPKTITQAWFTTCDARTDGATARVIAEDPEHFNDKVWGRGGPAKGDSPDSTAHKIDHSCYKASPIAVDTSVLAEVPAYEVMPRTVDEDYAESLAATLNMTGALSLSPDGQEYAITDTTGGMTRTLSIQTASGGYLLQDLSQLWVPPPPGEPLNLPGPEEAAALADAFFLANAEALPGIQYRDPDSEHIETDMIGDTAKPGTAAASSVYQEETGVDVMVAYGRTLATTAATAAGRPLAVEISVAGPGSSTKLYFGSQSGAYAAGALAGSPIGLGGGSRDVQAGNAVTLKDVGATWDAFEDDPALSVLPLPVAYDEMVRHAISDTFAYFEQPLGVQQKELIPTWVYNVDFIEGGETVLANSRVYVPASADYYPPDVVIDSPLPGAEIVAGKPIALNATVAGGNAPFTYEWSSAQGILGTAEDIAAALLGTSKAGEPPDPVTVALKVTDANGLSRTATVSVNVVGQPVWLPMVMSNQ